MSIVAEPCRRLWEEGERAPAEAGKKKCPLVRAVEKAPASSLPMLNLASTLFLIAKWVFISRVVTSRSSEGMSHQRGFNL